MIRCSGVQVVRWSVGQGDRWSGGQVGRWAGGHLGGVEEDDPGLAVDELVHVGGLGHLHLRLDVEPAQETS